MSLVSGFGFRGLGVSRTAASGHLADLELQTWHDLEARRP